MRPGASATKSGLMPKRSRATMSSPRRASHTAKANMPRKRRTQSMPSSSYWWAMTSVSQPLRKRWPLAMSSSRSSMKL